MNSWTVVSVFLVLVPCAYAGQEEENPFVEAAKVLLQDTLKNKRDGEGLVGVLQSFMQSDGGRQLGNMLTGSKEGGGAADLLSGLGSLLSATTGQGGGGGLDPDMIGNMVEMFASSATPKKKKPQEEEGIDWDSMLSLAGSFLGNQGGGHQQSTGFEGLLNILPVLLQSSGAGHENHDHSSFVPPILELINEYWQHFTKSELGQTLWKNSGLGNIMQLFMRDGKFDVDKIFDSLENNSFRRKWIRSLTSYIAEWISHVTHPETQQQYMNTASYIVNSILRQQGYKSFDSSRPAESLTALVNTIMKRQFGLKVESGTYIKPAFVYFQDLFNLGKSKGFSLSHLSSRDIESKLAEALNGEVIEPVLKVWRAYRYASRDPSCARYVICSVNNPQEQEPSNSTGLKPGVTKLASLVAAWYLSGTDGVPFWKFYNAIVEQHNCQEKYPADCNEYHVEDLKATTEYYHSEL